MVHSAPTALAAALLAAAVVVLSVPRGGSAEMARTHPRHLDGGKEVLRGQPNSEIPDYKNAGPNSRVLLERRQSLARLGGPDQRLSEACRRGQFRQARDRRYVAVLDKSIYGAGIGGSSALHDPGRIAQPGLVYIFVGQGTTNCRVYVGGGV